MYPLSNRPKITRKDIGLGYVMRYFIKTTSFKDIIEVDQKQYELFRTNTNYITLELKWLISGFANDIEAQDGNIIYGVRHKNRVTIDWYTQKLPGLDRILRNPLEYFQGIINKEQTPVINEPTSGNEPQLTPTPLSYSSNPSY